MAREYAFVPKLFISYAREDKLARDGLIKHLSILQRRGQITSWSDGEIRPGEAWADEIRTHLQTAHLILLLVSPDFFASDYCYSVEMVSALKRHSSGQARVIPIILRPVDWQKTPLRELQALPTNGKPVVHWKVRDDAFLDIVRGIEKTMEDWISPDELTLPTEELSDAQPSTSSDSLSSTLEQEETLSASSHTLRDTSKKASCVNEGQRIVVNLTKGENDGSQAVRAFLCTIDPGKGTVEVLTLTDETLRNVAASIHTTAQGSMIASTPFPHLAPTPDSECEEEPLSLESGRDDTKDEYGPSAHPDLKHVPLRSNQDNRIQLIEEPAIQVTVQKKSVWSVVANRLCSLVLTACGCILSLSTVSFLLIYSDMSIYVSFVSTHMSSWLLYLYTIISSSFIIALLLALYIKATPLIFYLCKRALKKGPLFDDMGL